jgi:cell division protein FtsZ
MADNVLYSGVRGITDLIVKPGLINLDFADVKSVMSEMGKAMMGTGEAEGERRAMDAAERAIANPLLDDVSMKGARGLLINITGGPDLTLLEVDEAANRVAQEVDPEANIITGATIDESMAGRIRVSVVATGMDREAAVEPKPSETVVKLQPRPAPVHVSRPVATGSGSAAAAVMATAPMRIEPQAAPQLAPVAVAAAAPAVEAAVAAPVQAEVAEPVAQAVVEAAPVRPERIAPQGASEPFAPPKPLPIPGRQSLLNRTAVAARDPFREADMVNGPKALEEKRNKVGLLQRIANMSRTAAVPTAERIEPAAPKVTATRPAPAPQPAPAPVAKQGGLLGGLEAAERPAPPAQDDLLDIPAFLRRQAN